MSTYLIVNRAPLDYQPSGKAMTAWNTWFEQLGAHLIDRGNPVFTASAIGACADETALGGYTLIDADDLDSALALARECPALAYGGGVEVGELTVVHSGTGPAEGYRSVLRFSAPVEAVLTALTTTEGLSTWWVPATGSGVEGGELRFHFDGAEPAVMHVDIANAATVAWSVLTCPVEPDWVGTRPTFTLSPTEEGGCRLEFHHIGLAPRLECYGQCSAHWGRYLAGLYDLVESDQRSAVRS
jgi:uncharacterized protein YndB with AHSA1/START domain